MEVVLPFLRSPDVIDVNKNFVDPFQWGLPLIDFTTHPGLTLFVIVWARCDNHRSADT